MLPIIRHPSLSKNNRWTWDVKGLPTSELALSIFSKALESISTKVDHIDIFSNRFLFTCTVSETKFNFCVWIDEEKSLFVVETYRLKGDYDLYKYYHQYLLEHAQQSFTVEPNKEYLYLKSIQARF